MSFFQDVKRDIHHHLNGPFYETPRKITPLRLLCAIIEPAFQIVFAYRCYHRLYKIGLLGLSYLMYIGVKATMRCDIAREASIGPGLRIVHPFDIVIGPDVHIGKDVVIFNGVTLGNRLSRDSWTGMPKVGDGVLIGTGAKILGPIHIGDNAKIGANAVVLISVPKNATAVGNPARIVSE